MANHSKTILLSALVLFTCAVLPAQAQRFLHYRDIDTTQKQLPIQASEADSLNNLRENWYWISFGGLWWDVEAGGNYIFFGRVNASIAFGNTLVSLRGSSVRIPGMQGYDVAALYGWTSRRDASFSSFALGLGYAFGETWEPRTYSKNPSSNPITVAPNMPFESIGLAFEAQLVAKLEIIGIGVNVYGNINFSKSLLGIAISLYVGWMP
jgi:hypothetical protein